MRRVRVLRGSPSAATALQCDVPFAEGRRFMHNELPVRGSARSPAGIAEVRVEIGSTRQAASLSGADSMRFEAVIDTSGWDPTTAVLTVTALDREGREAVEKGEVRVEPYAAPVSGKDAFAGDGTALHCRPLGPTAPHLPVSIRGWTYSSSGIDRVSVFLDGRSCHQALHGLTRPQLRTRLGTPEALEVGYYLLLDPYTCGSGEHVITVVATPKAGPPVGVRRSFMCADDTAGIRGEAAASVPAESSPRPTSTPLGASVAWPEDPDELREIAAGWKERALRAEAEAAAKLTELSQAQRGEERALLLLRAAEERRRGAERALERRPLRRLRRILPRLRGGS